MRNYEVTFIVDPVLSGGEIESTAETYKKMITDASCKITHTDEMGLRQLAFAIKSRNSGVYYCVEFESENGEVIPKLELALRRDERIMRFLTVHLDKYGVKYNADKRDGKIGKSERKRKNNSQLHSKVQADLTKIEGIGPKIAQLLAASGIITYGDLSTYSPQKIKGMLEKAGTGFTGHDPSTWPKQAALAAEEKWADLKEYQELLVGSKPAASSEEE